MKEKLSILGLGVLALVLATTTPADAANKEHQQLMADIRMLQEQSQVLQNLIGQVAEAIKAVNTRIDQQAEAQRKATADQKLIIDNLSNDVRVIREKIDDNNVRLGSLSQEVDALRQALQRPAPTATAPDTPDATGSQPAPGAPAGGGTVVNSPKQMYDSAYSDYTAGNYDLAIIGFDAFLKMFPKSDQADDAQVYICSSYLQQNKNDDAVKACDVAIRTYPGGNAIPEAYYRKALAQRNLKDVAGARSTLEELAKQFPDSQMALMGNQLLNQLPRRDD
ncbi:MAG TPA: outer membrane protein assembly factor BamD [Vicinamibacterales bacterium]|nr:outer membrane protein assembly factor BamD [Vicinamibacterales bacterium]